MKSTTDISDDVLRYLIDAGWNDRRDVSGQVLKWERELFEKHHEDLLENSKDILREFGLLSVGCGGKGVECAKSKINFDPTLIDAGWERICSFAEDLGVNFSLVGEIDGGHFYLVVDEGGKLYVLLDEIYLIGGDIRSAIDNLLTGVKGVEL